MIILLFLLGLVLWALGVSFGAWILMLLLGALASVTGWACAIGFVPCFIICVIIGLFTGGIRS